MNGSVLALQRIAEDRQTQNPLMQSHLHQYFLLDRRCSFRTLGSLRAHNSLERLELCSLAWGKLDVTRQY